MATDAMEEVLDAMKEVLERTCQSRCCKRGRSRGVEQKCPVCQIGDVI